MSNNIKYQVSLPTKDNFESQHIGDTIINKSSTPNRASRSPRESRIILWRLQLLIDTDAVLDKTRYIRQQLQNDKLNHDLRYILNSELNQINERWTTRLAGFLIENDTRSIQKLLDKYQKGIPEEFKEEIKRRLEKDIIKMEKLLAGIYSNTYSDLMGRRPR